MTPLLDRCPKNWTHLIGKRRGWDSNPRGQLALPVFKFWNTLSDRKRDEMICKNDTSFRRLRIAEHCTPFHENWDIRGTGRKRRCILRDRQALKQYYDPDGILTPGLNVF